MNRTAKKQMNRCDVFQYFHAGDDEQKNEKKSNENNPTKARVVSAGYRW